MSKIIVDRVELKNFFSYGNRWTDVPFDAGVNVVLGYDKDKERSNGAGKTSFLEAVPFALFGQTSKGVSLPKIVNWRNGKQCEVRLHFQKDGIPYILHRGIKPGILELTRDGVNVPKLSDKRVFQTEIENDLIGMDFKAAQALLFQNANNTISLFNTPKEQKRRFIEKFFNLEIYSKATEVTNKKMSNIEKRLSEIDSETTFIRQRIGELDRVITSFVAPDLGSYKGEVTRIRVDIDNFNDNNPDIREQIKSLDITSSEKCIVRDEVHVEIQKNKERLGDLRLEVRTMTSEKDTLTRRLIVIGDLTDQNEKLVKVKRALESFGGEREVIIAKNDLLGGLNEETKTFDRLITECKTDRRRIVSELDGWENRGSTGEGICPTCFQEVDQEHIVVHIEASITELKQKLSHMDIEMGGYEVRLEGLEENINSITSTVLSYENRLDKRRKLEQAFTKLSGVEEKQVEQNEINDRLGVIDGVVLGMDEEIETLSIRITEKEERHTIIVQELLGIDEQYEKCKNDIRLYEQLGKDLDNAEKILNNQKEIFDRLVGENEANIASKSELEVQIVSTQSEVKKLDTMKDYLEHVKFTLRDENVKQYAISGIVPYLQQRTNHYLSETGHNYYIELDNWLDGKIRGFGVGDCDFGNMSGGEGKSIDLALKFAMMDVARRQAGSYLDVLILDELLDSSIDSFGLEKTMDIVRMKQIEDNLKVFIVSHREEVAGFGADRIYQVVKENGMSTIGIIGD